MNVNKYILHQWFYYCGWINLFAIIRFFGWDDTEIALESGGISVIEFLIIGNLGALIGGIVTGLFEAKKRQWFSRKILRKYGNIIRLFGFFILVFVSAFLASFLVIMGLEAWKMHLVFPRMDEILFSSGFRVTLLFLMVVSMINVALLSFMDWHGMATFLSIITGKINLSKKEERVFLFVDMNASTTISNKLGFDRYSDLIQSCFNMLRGLAKKFDSEVYQYVGDEMILSWPKDKAYRNDQCIRLFVEFKALLNKSSGEYQEKYGIVPQFKAALSAGTVLTTTIGQDQKYKAFYGRPLHIAARMLEKCKMLKTDFLLTVESKAEILSDTFTFNYVESTRLRGDTEVTHLFEVKRGKHLTDAY